MKKYIFTIFISILVLFCITYPQSMINSTKSALSIWVTIIIPSLFPFIILSDLIQKTALPFLFNKILSPIMHLIFKLPGISSIAIFLGMIGGYPIGSKITSDLLEEKSISKNDANHLIMFVNNTGPLFLLGAVGIGIYKNSQIGILLLISHYISAILIGLITGFLKKENKISSQPKIIKFQIIKLSEIGNILNETIKKSINIVLSIGGFIVLFSIISSLLEQTKITALLSKYILWFLPVKTSNALISGVLELTSGINKISLENIPLIYKLSITSFLIGFGGLSIHFQTLSIISKTNISFLRYILGKTMHGIISGIFTYYLLSYTRFSQLIPITTSNFKLTNLEISNTLNIVTIFFIFIVIYKIFQTLIQIKNLSIFKVK